MQTLNNNDLAFLAILGNGDMTARALRMYADRTYLFTELATPHLCVMWDAYVDLLQQARSTPGMKRTREVAAAFRMIDEASAPVVVRYGGNEKLIEQLRVVGPKRPIMRRLQRYTVNVPQRTLGDLSQKGFVEEMHPGVHVQTLDSLYSEAFGLDIFREALKGEETIL